MAQGDTNSGPDTPQDQGNAQPPTPQPGTLDSSFLDPAKATLNAALIKAEQSGNLQLVEELRAQGADPNSVVNGATGISAVAANNDIQGLNLNAIQAVGGLAPAPVTLTSTTPNDEDSRDPTDRPPTPAQAAVTDDVEGVDASELRVAADLALAAGLVDVAAVLDREATEETRRLDEEDDDNDAQEDYRLEEMTYDGSQYTDATEWAGDDDDYEFGDNEFGADDPYDDYGYGYNMDGMDNDPYSYDAYDSYGPYEPYEYGDEQEPNWGGYGDDAFAGSALGADYAGGPDPFATGPDPFAAGPDPFAGTTGAFAPDPGGGPDPFGLGTTAGATTPGTTPGTTSSFFTPDSLSPAAASAVPPANANSMFFTPSLLGNTSVYSTQFFSPTQIASAATPAAAVPAAAIPAARAPSVAAAPGGP